jgi:peptidoglycan/xylan/chitin deacetylase (PgdA/CDA1 family)
MKRGREELEKLIGVTPELFVPPNHHFDEATLEAAAELEYKFFTDQAVIRIKPYKFGDMLVIPEGNMVGKGIRGRAAVYIHYNRISSNFGAYAGIVMPGTISWHELKAEDFDPNVNMMNKKLRYSRKLMSDILKLPRRLLNE